MITNTNKSSEHHSGAGDLGTHGMDTRGVNNRGLNKRGLIAVLAAALAIPSMSMAQMEPHHEDPGHGRQDMRDEPSAPPRGMPSRSHGPAPDEHADMRGAGPDHAFRRGGRLPPDYRSKQYVVDDWRGHHLTAPPRGYHWVQTGADYVLVAVATGIIAQVLLNQ